ncbi:MAG: hypothetical protein A2W90_01255 [Bacteroidetes bacterium GWF2_42_66]|nr:MAG: hypothetical protein A2W92_00675 [Bacteroidetes bacterium GWA2_42_15]OFY01005.1 MAG: hypothetical protein A2W89_14745 [Bacteroidetes bacterium GWE2_42_39]OFY41845.1 MAG: hypothetical protein A2W90_01255 [Bacteroidetes bacterium GWF2_42_66]HBL77981.1 hypothetical protein [Prolixibacteraceae bacterium]HCR90255.1 hypothetical protein [Prolixibacteraceae bacterium]
MTSTDQNLLKSIAGEFKTEGEIISVRPFGNGHINDTFLIETAGEKPNYILQRKNHLIFKDVPAMMENIDRVCKHIESKLRKANDPLLGKKTIRQISTHDAKLYFKDEKGNFWTVMNFVANSKSVEMIEKPEMAEVAGIAFGRFQKQLADLPGGPLSETIKDFHNIYFRINNFEKAKASNPVGRLATVKAEVEEIESRMEKMKTLQKLADSGKLPIRVTHNDTKINNVLFDKDTDEILAVIDLDTVMPGLVHFDFGDAMRTAANTVEEDETDISKVKFNLEVFRYFTKGFLSETRDTLTPQEIELLPHSCQFMTYIMALRFLTDYIDGDTYYKIKHPEHNIERARNQIKLVQEMEKSEQKMKEVVNAAIKN